MKMLGCICAEMLIAKDVGGEPILESWVDWVRRTTADVREAMQTHQIPEWVDQQREKVRAWRERLQFMDEHRWAKQAVRWQPDGWRSRGHPRTRWADVSSV